MRDLKEAGAKLAAQTRCEPLVGLKEGARYPRLSKPNILSVFLWVEEVSEQRKYTILPGDGPSAPGRCNCDSQALSGAAM